ncbi:hypothetical protein GCM10023347_10590 [Streptomyces chumphonensis]
MRTDPGGGRGHARRGRTDGTPERARGRRARRLRTLAEEGALSVDDVPRSARLLSTVVNGLAFQRAMPAEDTLTERERETLYTAVDAVLRPHPPAPRRRPSRPLTREGRIEEYVSLKCTSL